MPEEEKGWCREEEKNGRQEEGREHGHGRGLVFPRWNAAKLECGRL